MTNEHRKIEILISKHYQLIEETKSNEFLRKDIIIVEGKQYLFQKSFYNVSFSSEEGIDIKDVQDSKSFPRDNIEGLATYLVKDKGIRHISRLSFPKQIWIDTDIDDSAIKYQGLSLDEYSLFLEQFEHINSGYRPAKERQEVFPFVN
ncbi:hypothetical protein HN385_01120 [archaeon]|jgi:hypothetical protein|nr:hypothetical protein [archaeon]MBT3451145.1 hypothetical protein [archaeon]MBT6869296.1 hypothetical protein [archaeon]MBT7192459.1 hypothetical protein [archaeon]MBT7380535.1 hypothetical protein [archaeon]